MGANIPAKKATQLKRKISQATHAAELVDLAVEIFTAGDPAWSRQVLDQALGSTESCEEELDCALAAHRCGWSSDEECGAEDRGPGV